MKRVQQPPRQPVVDEGSRQALGSIGLLLGSASGRAGQIAAHAILARALGVEAFGLYVLGWTIVQLSQSAGHLGLCDGVVRFLSRHRGTDHGQVKDLLTRALGLSLLMGLLLGSVAWFGAGDLAGALFGKPDFGGVLRAFAPAIVVAPLLIVAVGATRATSQMRHSILAFDAGLPLMILIVVSVLAFHGTRTTGMALATSAAFLVATGVALSQVGWLYRTEIRASRCPRQEREPLVRFSLAALSMSISMLLLLWSDRLFIGAFRPAAEVGAYHAASQLSVVTVVVYQPLAAVLAPLVAGAAWRTNAAALRVGYQNVCRWGLYLVAPLLVLAFVLAAPILGWIYGAQFSVSAPAARLLIVGQTSWLVGGVVGTVLVMTGHQRLWLWCSTLAVLANLGLNGLLVPTYGMLGAAAATAVCQIGLYGGGCLLVRLRLGVWPLARGTLVAVLASGLTVALGLSLSNLLGDGNIWMMAGVACAAIGVLYAVIVATGTYCADTSILQYLRELRLRGFAGRTGGAA